MKRYAHAWLVAVLVLTTPMVVAEAQEPTRRGTVELGQNFPNPFNPATTIRYTVPSRGRVEVSVFDLRGSRVTTLVDEERDAGAFTEAWNGRDDAGRSVASGVYFARVTHPAGAKSYKVVLLK